MNPAALLARSATMTAQDLARNKAGDSGSVSVFLDDNDIIFSVGGADLPHILGRRWSNNLFPAGRPVKIYMGDGFMELLKEWGAKMIEPYFDPELTEYRKNPSGRPYVDFQPPPPDDQEAEAAAPEREPEPVSEAKPPVETEPKPKRLPPPPPPPEETRSTLQGERVTTHGWRRWGWGKWGRRW